jgi:benzylsuccinate CoA-transferase BbsF subunit
MTNPDSPNADVFRGLRVLDFTWAAAGPIITKYLADFGATVVKVESSEHPDSVRFGGPFAQDIPGINRSGFFADFNTSKKSLALNMRREEARSIARDFVAWADIITESFTPRVMKGWGFSYEDVQKVNPSIIMLSTCLQGGTGPYREYAGYGGQGGALSGIHYLTGWPDRAPAGPKGAYTDTIAPRFGVAVLVAALLYRERTGLGQHIDLSHIETAAQFLGTEILDHCVNASPSERRGNRGRSSAPCGAFPVRGEDRFVTIEVRSDDEWRSVLDVFGSPPELADERFATVVSRKQHEDALEPLLARHTASNDPYDLLARLQARRVPSGVVQKGSDLFDDPQLAHRGHFVSLEHAEMGPLLYNGPAFQLSKTPARLRSAPPLLGEHTREVLQEVLGLAPEKIDALIEDGVLV